MPLSSTMTPSLPGLLAIYEEVKLAVKAGLRGKPQLSIHLFGDKRQSVDVDAVCSLSGNLQI